MNISALTPAAEAFDRLSIHYQRLCDNPVFAWMRGRVHAAWAEMIPPGARVLEIGCGIGLDTAFLAGRGADVTAVDPAPGMLRHTEARLAAHRPALRARLLRAGLETLDEAIERDGGPGRFDAIVSNFGALNCVEELGLLRGLAERRLAPDGRLSLGLMTRTCAWEIAGFLACLRPGDAFRRLGRGPRLVSVEGVLVPTFYHRPGDVMAALGPAFTVRRLEGLAVLVPPPFAAHRWALAPASVRRLVTAADTAVSSSWPFNRLGDHFLIEIGRA
jgi:SAM-dependent methyltransferase